MKIIKTHTRIKKIGLAYSGGLDTSVIIKWLTHHKKKVIAFFADLGQSSHKHIKKIKKRAYAYGAKKFYVIDGKQQLCQEALKALQCSAFAFKTGTNKYYNTTPLGRIVTAILITNKMTQKNIKIWCDGSTYKGNDIERFLRYTLLTNTHIDFYKPWLDKTFIKDFKGRNTMSRYIKIQNQYSMDTNLLGKTYEGGTIENLDTDISTIKYKWCTHLTNTTAINPEITLHIKHGKITKLNNKTQPLSKIFNKLNKLCGLKKIGITDQIEERVTGIKSRGIYEAPAMELLHNIYERAISCLYDKTLIITRNYLGELLGHKLYEGKWFDDLATLIKTLGKTICKPINGKITCKLLNNQILFTNTKLKTTTYNKKLISMNDTATGFTGNDRIGYLNIIKTALNTSHTTKFKTLI
ncbi:argininosuccinate synthase [Candidatus Vidania fulgoroideae]|uniref:argininosuccinate synthase n=1 Tax=Candidatus Vidania fulgoroideorum TaxID=881286 RepID=A0A974X737_9PROT|nr:argininosuccinate synthase [Candidatus Vidania fulgoroideae]